MTLNTDSRQAVAVVADAMRRVSEQMQRKPYGTGIEKAFLMVASELEAEALNLDPKPMEFLYRLAGREAGDREGYEISEVFAPTDVTFAPRHGYNQEEYRYKEWLANRV